MFKVTTSDPATGELGSLNLQYASWDICEIFTLRKQILMTVKMHKNLDLNVLLQQFSDAKFADPQ